jgi:O-antigen/teichoic acid export membrane protein/GT2 family glycosyltransferase
MPSASVATHSPRALAPAPPTPFRDRRRLSLRKNSALNLAGTALGLGLGLIVTPYVVVRLGLQAFGFVALISAFSQYASLFDFGVGATVMRAISHHDERSDVDAIRRKAASALWSSTGFAVVVVGAVSAVLWALPAHALGNLPAGWKWAVIAVAVSVACSSLASVFQAFPSGMGRWDLTNASSVTNQVVYSVVVVVALALHPNLYALAVATAAAGISGLLVAYLVYRSRWHLRLSPRAARRDELWGLWTYGLSVQTVGLTAVINMQADKPVLLLFTSLKFVGLYEIGSRITLAIRALAITAFGPLSAHAARVFSRGGREQLATEYESSYRSTMLLGLAPLVALFSLSYVFVLVWVGQGFRTGGVIALILGAGCAVNLATGAGTSVAMGAGRADLDRNYSVLSVMLNLALTIGLGLLVGGWGVIVATALSQIIASFWLLYTVDRWLGTSILSPGRVAGDRVGRWLLALAVALGALATLVAAGVPIHGRVAAGCVLLGAGAIFALAWLLALSHANVISVKAIIRRRAGAVAAAGTDSDANASASPAAGAAVTMGAQTAAAAPPDAPPVVTQAGAAARPQAAPAPEIAVIVISHNGADHIGTTLAALDRQTVERTRFDLIVVDDGSTDRTGEVARAAGARVIRLQPNRGPGAARAAGVAAAGTARLIAFTDDDCLPRADWLQEVVAPFQDPVVDGVGGRIEPVTEPGLIARFFAIRNPWSPLSDDFLRSSNRWFRLWLYLRSVAHADADPRGSGLFSVAGGNMAFRRSALDSVGGFAESHRVSEETELCRRLHNRPGGARIVYQRSAEVGHHFDAGLASVLQRARRYGGGTAQMAQTHDDVGLIAYPFPLFSGAAILAALLSRRGAVIACALASPLVLYLGWTRRAVARRDPGNLAFPYLQLLMESATMVGELLELVRLRRHPVTEA